LYFDPDFCDTPHKPHITECFDSCGGDSASGRFHISIFWLFTYDITDEHTRELQRGYYRGNTAVISGKTAVKGNIFL